MGCRRELHTYHCESAYSGPTSERIAADRLVFLGEKLSLEEWYDIFYSMGFGGAFVEV